MTTLPPGRRLPMPVHTMLAAVATERYTDFCVRRDGAMVRLHVLGLGRFVALKFVALNYPALIREVFTGDRDVLRAGEANAALAIADAVLRAGDAPGG